MKTRSIESYISIHRNIRHKVLHFICSITEVTLYLERKRQSALWIELQIIHHSLEYTITSNNNLLPIIYAEVQQGVKSYMYN